MDLPDALWGHVLLFLSSRECAHAVERVSARFEAIVRSDALARARWGVSGKRLARWACVGCDRIEGAVFQPLPSYYQEGLPPLPRHYAGQFRPAAYACLACLDRWPAAPLPFAYANPPRKGLALTDQGVRLHWSAVAEHLFRELCAVLVRRRVLSGGRPG